MLESPPSPTLSRAFIVVALALALPVAGPARAQSFPDKPIRFVVPYAPGGSTDFLARMLAQHYTEVWKQPVVVDNRGGGGGTIGADLVARSPADGHTLVLTAGSHATAVGIYRKLPYDLLTDLQAVGLIATQPNALVVHPSLPVRNVKELIALARARPGELAFSSSGNGGFQHLIGELFKAQANVNLIHVPYKGTAPALADLIGGQVSMSVQPVINAVPSAKAGRIRMVAVTGPQRTAVAPEVPTVRESGLPDFSVVAWYGVHVPARTPRPIVDALNGQMRKLLSSGDTRQRLLGQGMEPALTTPDEFADFVRSEVARWTKVIRNAGITEN